MTADASHLAKPQTCEWTRQRTFPFCTNVLRSWAPISLSRIISLRNVSCTQHTTVARLHIYLHRLRMWWQKHRSKFQPRGCLATFQIRDFQLNLASENDNADWTLAKSQTRWRPASENLTLEVFDNPHLQQEHRGSSQTRPESGYPTTR
jgi:hypothetical protein